MSEITLSFAARTALVATQRTAALADSTRERLATGFRVNRPIDNAPAFFLAQNLSNRAGDLLAVKDGIGQSASALGGALAGIDAITSIVNQLKGIAISAKGGSADVRAARAAQFDALRGQIDSLAADVGFGGINLLASPPDSFTVDFNERGASSLTIEGAASDASSLGIGTAAGAFNGFATDADILSAIAQLDGAVGTLRSTASTLGLNATLLNTRLEFTNDLVNTLESGAQKLVGADLNEEAANLLALRLSAELGALGLNIANQNNQSILKLF